MSQENSTTSNKSITSNNSNNNNNIREDSTGGVGGVSLLSSGNINDDDSFNPYKSNSKSPIGSISSLNRSQQSQLSFISGSSVVTDSEARNLNVHLLQGNNIDRSWIDPWEITPSAKLYQKNYQSPTPHLVASSILPNSYNRNNIINNNNNNNNNSNAMILNSGSGIYSIDEKGGDNPLQSPLLLDPDIDDKEEEEEEEGEVIDNKKFGPWDGVMTGALLNIWGVILFLRLGWIIGQAGIRDTILIILLSTTVTTLTTISMAAICTNGQVRAGGAYYIISRTIGPQFGGSVGMILSIGSMVAVSLYLIGFAQALATNLQDQANFQIFNHQINDIRLWATIFLIIVLILAIIGLKYVIKAQIGLLIWIIFSIISLIIGSFYQTNDSNNPSNSDDPQLYGFIKGLKDNFINNLGPDYQDNYTFWSVLAIFFPAVTGIMAGANLSGDLRNPSRDIPKGTFTAIIISSTTYIILVILIGSTADRVSLINCPLIMTNICMLNGYIVYIATYAATISSAIASLVGAPRILQAVGDDNIMNIPGLSFFTESNDEGNPIRGYYLTAIIALLVNLIGNIDLVAPLISLFFIMVYLLINFSCFIMDISKSPGWRPGFKYFNAWTAFAGTILCGAVMFLLAPYYALATLSIAIFFYVYVAIYDPNVSWGGAFHSRAIYKTYRSLLNLALTDKSDINDNKNKKTQFNFRPSFLVMQFGKKYSLTKYVETLRKSYSLIFSCSIIKQDYRKTVMTRFDDKISSSLKKRINKQEPGEKSYVSIKEGYLPIRKFTHKNMKIKGKRSLGFNDIITTDGSYRNCMQTVLQNAGLGALRPNTLILNLLRIEQDNQTEEEEEEEEEEENESDNDDDDYKLNMDVNNDNDNDNDKDIECDEYIEILRDSLLYGYGVMICHGLCDIEKYHKIDWNLNNCFENIIDVWWIVDDGGLILLIPYIMCLCTYWSKCKVRINLIFDINDNINESEQIQKINGLIIKFRLNKVYHNQPRIIRVKNSNPSRNTIVRFERLSESKIKNTTRQKVILRWLKLSELLNEYSKQSMINIVTLPVPTSHIKPKQYIAILNLLSDQNTLPPTIIMRGNGEQTLTFYSE